MESMLLIASVLLVVVCVGLIGMGWLLWQMLSQQGRMLLRLENVEAGQSIAGQVMPLASGPGELFPRQDVSPRPKVFGIGLSRTGTTSLTEALELLGYRALHWPGGQLTQLEVYRFFATGADHIHLSLLKEYDALTDTPVCCLYQALDKAYPGSKFILTVRDKRAWLRSYQDLRHRQLHTFNEKPNSLHLHYRHFVTERLYGTQSADPAVLSPAYDRHTAEVLDYFKERPHDLLVLDICGGEGWNKLAPFLGMPMPEIPFPWKNRTPQQEEPGEGKHETSDATRWQPQEIEQTVRV